ncbi:hypothetical protein Ate02nite_53570 [Paractinoplanes tereljensis]|uniref:Uncharacterized protein n=1 Tax=Paractinoplanes tereljensis TaxID=571912 RepID=A0A919TW76_9ACTN|nr:hypothetical protein Ate02nite_53570 [Actinoplanes tereljensis]
MNGSWYFACVVPVLPGRRERLHRGGYLTRREAIAARDGLLGDGDTVTAEGWTMQPWLRYWLTTRTRIRPIGGIGAGGLTPDIPGAWRGIGVAHRGRNRLAAPSVVLRAKPLYCGRHRAPVGAGAPVRARRADAARTDLFEPDARLMIVAADGIRWAGEVGEPR